MEFWDKLKNLVSEKEPEVEEDLVEETKWSDKFKEAIEQDKINLGKQEPKPQSDTVEVQINGSYEFKLEKNPHAERLNINYHGIEYDLFDIFVIFHASINCTVDEYKITIPAHYKIHMAGGMSEEKAYIKLAERTEEEEREFIMDELKPRVINDIKEKISEERYKQIKKQVEEKGKIRFDVVMDIEKDKLTK